MSGRQRVLFRRRLGLSRAGVVMALLGHVAFLSVVWVLPVGGADKVAVVDTRTVVEAYYNIMAGPGLDPKTQIGPDPQEVRKVEDELQRLKAEYARQRAGLSPEAKATYEKGVLKVVMPKEERGKPRSVKVEVK